MFRIAKEFCFSASHQLDHLPADHPCARLHGHNYRVTLLFERAHLGEEGFVLDFRKLDGVKKWIDDAFDHRHLNDVLGSGKATTSENLARMIFDEHILEFSDLVGVRVSETDKTYAEYLMLLREGT